VGVFVGVYRIPPVFVNIVNLPVALPVICPGVMLAVTVKYLLTAVLFGNKSVPRVIGGKLQEKRYLRVVRGSKTAGMVDLDCIRRC